MFLHLKGHASGFTGFSNHLQDYLYVHINNIITEVMRSKPKYVLCNITRELGLTVTNWFSSWLRQRSITPMFKSNNSDFLHNQLAMEYENEPRK